MTGRRAIFTALTGQHELLTEQPVAAASELDFICFTDDPDLRSESWDVRLVEPLLAMDPVRSARAIKISGHADLADYDETLWIDARVRLTTDPAEILDTWLDGTDVAVPRHSFRKDVVTEFEEVLLAGLDDFSRLYEQLTHYSVLGPGRLQDPVPWTGMLARRRTEAVERAMDRWWVHVLRYSRRDQLSFVEAVASAEVPFRLVELDNWGSSLHEWLPGEGRSTRPNVFRMSESLRTPAAALGELQRRLDAATREYSGALDARELALREAERALASSRREATRLGRANAELEKQVRQSQTPPATTRRLPRRVADYVRRLLRR